jgi:hypothetical protein
MHFEARRYIVLEALSDFYFIRIRSPLRFQALSHGYWPKSKAFDTECSFLKLWKPASNPLMHLCAKSAISVRTPDFVACIDISIPPLSLAV